MANLEGIERVQMLPGVCHGKPVIKGTRILVTNLLGALSGGDSFEDLLADYPGLTREDIFAALRFGADLANGNFIAN